MAYASLVDEFQNDGRAVVAAGDERPPAAFRAMVDEVLAADSPADGRDIPPEQRELEQALGVGGHG